MAYLVLIRHGQSAWNEKELWTGLTDIALNEKGHEEAIQAAEHIPQITFDAAYTSNLKRSQQTLEDILATLHQSPTIYKSDALNEKDYGIYTGKNKWEVKKEVGDDEFLKIRRSWDYRIPEGESLKDVYNRAIPYYKEHILKDLEAGKNVLVVAHNNSLRALVKYLENVSDADIPGRELATGEAYIYQVSKNGDILKT